MSIRDSASGSSDWHGGGGSFSNGGASANGGLGGGMGGGGGGGGSGAYQSARTGINTGKDWYGNTAFSTPGSALAAQYAMRDADSLARAGMGPTAGTYSQYKTLTGAPMFPGLPNPMAGVNAPSAMAGASKLADMQRAMAAAQARVGGLLSGEGVVTGPIPNVMPTAAPPGMPSVFNQDWLNQIAAFRQKMLANGQGVPQAPSVDHFPPGYSWGSYINRNQHSAKPGDAPQWTGSGRSYPGMNNGGGGNWNGVDLQNGINGMNGH